MIFHTFRTFRQKKSILLATMTFFTYFCRSSNKVKEYEYKTEKIYLAGRRNTKILVQHTGGHEEQTHAATQSSNQGTVET